MDVYLRQGSKFYQARFNVGSQLVRVSTGKTDKDDAIRQAIRIQMRMEIDAERGVDPTIPKVKKVFAAWLKTLSAEKAQEYLWNYNAAVKDQFHERRLTDISVGEIEASIDHYNLVRRNMMRGMWKHIFRHAIKIDHRIEMPPIQTERHQFDARQAFTKPELDRLLKELRNNRFSSKNRRDGYTRDMNFLLYYYVVLLAATGMRPGKEASSLRYAEFQLATVVGHQNVWQCHIKKHTTKVRRERYALVDQWANVYLQELETFHRRYLKTKKDFLAHCKWDHVHLFGDRNGTVPLRFSEAFRRELSRLNLLYDIDGNERCLYSIRHHFITRKLEAGKPVANIALQCGNSVPVIMSTYQKVVAANQAAHVLD